MQSSITETCTVASLIPRRLGPPGATRSRWIKTRCLLFAVWSQYSGQSQQTFPYKPGVLS